MMKFELNRKLKQNYAYEVNELDNTMIDALANVLTEKQYHELCH
jgi:hypothetical protein